MGAAADPSPRSRGGRTGAAWLVFTLVVLVPVACHRSKGKGTSTQPAPVLVSVAFQDHSQAGGAKDFKMDTDRLAAIVRDKLVGAGLVTRPPVDAGGADPTPASPVVTARGVTAFEVVETEDKGVVRGGVRLRLQTKPEAIGRAALDEDLSAEAERPFVPSPGLDRAKLVEETAEKAAGDLVEGFIARRSLAIAAPAAIHAALIADGGVALREEAIRQVASRRLADEVPTLLGLLESPVETTRDAALGALLRMHERRAVPVLARSRSMRDRREMLKILSAIAELGGDEARDYLSFVADSHEDPEIRAAAAAARRRLASQSTPSAH